jgi:hypothetical protein
MTPTTYPAFTPAPHDVVRPARGDAPRVSVLVPTYNTRRYVREAVESLLAQTFVEHEILVIDDASTDASTEALEHLDDPRLRIVRHHRNHGLSGARNTGLALARGDYIALLDADDVARPRRLERQAALLDARPEVGVVATWTNRIDAEGRLVGTAGDEWRLPDAALRPLLLFCNPFSASTLMLRRAVLPAHGFKPVYAEDYAMTADISRLAELAVVHELLVDYRHTPGSIMQSKLDRVAEAALATQRSLLADIGLADADYDPERAKALMYFGAATAQPLTLERLLELRHWMEGVAAANARSARHPRLALRQASARMWDHVLLQATKRAGLLPGWRYLTLAWPFLLEHCDASLRARALAHAALNALPFDARRLRASRARP